MKILLVDVNCKNSSTGKIVYDLYEKLNADGMEAAICYGRGPLVKEKNIFKFGLDFETCFHAGLSRLTGLNGCFSLFSTLRLINFVKKFKPDVIHIHELHAYFINIKKFLNFIKKLKAKIVWTFHCEYMYTGKCGHSNECDKWKIECKKCPLLHSYPKSLFFDFTKRMFGTKKNVLSNLDFTIVTPSNWLLNRVKESFLKDKKALVIHNGIDTTNLFFPREDSEIQSLKDKYKLNGKRIVLSVAPDIMSENKGGEKVIEISKSFINTDVQFVLVGIKNEFSAPNNVTLIKRTSNQVELAHWYSMANVFLICSKRENFPTTCLEAVCCGTPIVGFDAGGAKETAPYPFGKFVEYGDIDSAVKEIETFLSLKSKPFGIREFGDKNYSKKNMYLAYKQIYLENKNGK